MTHARQSSSKTQKGFDHSQTGYVLQGKHAQISFACGCKDNSQTTATTPAQTAAIPSPTLSQVSTSDEEAIRQAVEDHVRNNKGINMAAMDMSVDSITVNGDQAQANATFRLKQGGPP